VEKPLGGAGARRVGTADCKMLSIAGRVYGISSFQSQPSYLRMFQSSFPVISVLFHSCLPATLTDHFVGAFLVVPASRLRWIDSAAEGTF